MKDIIFIIGLIVVIIITVKLFVWALKGVIFFALIAAIIYVLYRVGALFGKSKKE